MTLMRFPTAARHDVEVDAWIAARRDDLRPLVAAWFAQLRSRGDRVRELMHDGCATACVDDAAFAHVGAYAAHVSVYFFFGAHLDDPKGLLEGTGKHGRHVKLRPGQTVARDALANLIDAAYEDVIARLDR